MDSHTNNLCGDLGDSLYVSWLAATTAEIYPFHHRILSSIIHSPFALPSRSGTARHEFHRFCPYSGLSIIFVKLSARKNVSSTNLVIFFASALGSMYAVCSGFLAIFAGRKL